MQSDCRTSCALVATLALAANPLSAQTPASFHSLGRDIYPNAVSNDGSTIVGNVPGGAFRWTDADGMVLLGILPGYTGSNAAGISADGAVIVGSCSSSGGVSQAFRWTAGGGMVGLGFLPGGTHSGASAVSADGLTVVGTGDTNEYPYGNACFRWTMNGGMRLMHRGPGSVEIGPSSGAYPTGVSGDGSVVVGQGRNPQPTGAPVPFRYTVGLGATLFGSAEPAGGVIGWLSGAAGMITPDAKYLVGTTDPPGMGVGFRWNENRGWISLGVLPGGLAQSLPWGVSADGAFVVGSSVTGATYSDETAFLWDEENGMRNLVGVLTDVYCLTPALSEWRRTVATGISGDGRTIVGRGRSPNDENEGWVARLGTPTPGDLNRDGDVDLNDLSRLLADYGKTGTVCEALASDIDHDHAVGLSDLAILLAHFGTTCP